MIVYDAGLVELVKAPSLPNLVVAKYRWRLLQFDVWVDSLTTLLAHVFSVASVDAAFGVADVAFFANHSLAVADIAPTLFIEEHFAGLGSQSATSTANPVSERMPSHSNIILSMSQRADPSEPRAENVLSLTPPSVLLVVPSVSPPSTA